MGTAAAGRGGDECLLSPEDQLKLRRLAQLDDMLSLQLEPRARMLRSTLERRDDELIELDREERNARISARLVRLRRVIGATAVRFNSLLAELSGER